MSIALAFVAVTSDSNSTTGVNACMLKDSSLTKSVFEEYVVSNRDTFFGSTAWINAGKQVRCQKDHSWRGSPCVIYLVPSVRIHICKTVPHDAVQRQV